MAPDWAKANRPLVLIFTAITFLVTILFNADVNAQGGAYATGVLVLMASAAVAVTLYAWRAGAMDRLPGAHARLRLHDRGEHHRAPRRHQDRVDLHRRHHLHVAHSRVLRSTELRVDGVDADEVAKALHPRSGGLPVRIIANRPDLGNREEYDNKLREARESHHLPPDERVLFVEVRPGDVSEFSDRLEVTGADVEGHHVLRCVSPAIPNAIAALLLYCRDETGKIPHAYFGWTEGNPIVYLMKFLAFGEGDTAPVTREVLRQAEPDPMRRPRIHVG